jgi:hypothetical protein
MEVHNLPIKFIAVTLFFLEMPDPLAVSLAVKIILFLGVLILI